MNRRLSFALFSALLAIWAAPVYSEEVTTIAPETLLDAIKQGKPMTSFRLRYENLNQEGYQSTAVDAKKLDTGEAFTLRSLIGWQTAPFKTFSFAANLQMCMSLIMTSMIGAIT